MKFASKRRVWRNRITALRKDIAVLFSISFFSILLIELVLKHIPSNSELQYDLGVIYLRLCYSFTATIITYYLFIHLPLEKRKSNSFLILNNKTHEIHQEVWFLIECINKVNGTKLKIGISKEDEINEVLRAINPHNSVLSPLESNTEFSNWFEYLLFKNEQIRKCIYELLMLNDILDSDYRQTLTFILDKISRSYVFKGKVLGNANMMFSAPEVYELVKYTNKLNEIARNNYNRYAIEYHEQYKEERRKEDA